MCSIDRYVIQQKVEIYLIICDKPTNRYKAFKKHISRRNMPQFSRTYWEIIWKLISNKVNGVIYRHWSMWSFHRRWMNILKHILLCMTLWHYKKYFFWAMTTLLQYISDLLKLLQITHYSALDQNLSVFEQDYIVWLNSHLLWNAALLSVSCAKRKRIHLSWRHWSKIQHIIWNFNRCMRLWVR